MKHCLAIGHRTAMKSALLPAPVGYRTGRSVYDTNLEPAARS
jgi:hypothetical protein